MQGNHNQMHAAALKFIADFLRQSLSPSERRRFATLALNELKRMEANDVNLTVEIADLKSQIVRTSPEILNQQLIKRSQDKWRPEHRPKDVADFMSLFNKRDGLKYLTHDFDEEGDFSIDYFLTNCRKIFGAYLNGVDKYHIPTSLWKIVNEFSFQKHPNWTNVEGQRMTSGWSTGEWAAWAKNHNLHPIRNIQEFKPVIESFRSLTRVESPYLSKIIVSILEDVFQSERENFQVELHSLDKADFYTHVPSFKRALTSIFELMKSRKHHKTLQVRYERATDDEYFVRKVMITQVDSYPTRELDILCKEWQSDKGAMGGIRNNLYGYCHWSIETLIENVPMRMNILKERQTPELEKLDHAQVIGFSHILTFYYR